MKALLIIGKFLTGLSAVALLITLTYANGLLWMRIWPSAFPVLGDYFISTVFFAGAAGGILEGVTVWIALIFGCALYSLGEGIWDTLRR